MKLPKISHPLFDIVIPSTKKKIKLRPMLVKEEKIINLVNVLSLSLEPKTRYEVLNSFGLTNIYKNYESHIAVLLDNGIMQRTIPDKPRSPKQKYRTTEKGKQLLKLIKDN